MNDGEMLLRAILGDPGDDARRLVYADWLEEHGQGERAEFVRVQCELAGVPACRVEGKVVNWQSPLRACRDVFPIPHEGKGHGPHCDPCRRFVSLSRRERELLGAHAATWALGLPGGWVADLPACPVGEGERVGRTLYAFRRGFVEAVECTAADFLAHESAIRAAHPVTRVRLTTLPVGDGKPGRTPAGMPADAGAALNKLRHRHYWVLPERLLDVLRRVWPRIDFEVPPRGYLAGPVVEIGGQLFQARGFTVRDGDPGA